MNEELDKDSWKNKGASPRPPEFPAIIVHYLFLFPGKCKDMISLCVAETVAVRERNY